MLKNNAANVIDLEAFRQRRMRAEGRSNEGTVLRRDEVIPTMFVPVWFCWVPMWTPVLG